MKVFFPLILLFLHINLQFQLKAKLLMKNCLAITLMIFGFTHQSYTPVDISSLQHLKKLNKYNFSIQI